MKLSPAGLAFIERWERYAAYPYLDQGGVWTIGFGATTDMNHLKITQGTPPISIDDAAKLLARDVATAEIAVNIGVTRELKQNEFDALVAFVYNIGIGAFHTSTVLKLVNLSLDPTASWETWDHVKGKVSTGLENRRMAEVAVYMA